MELGFGGSGLIAQAVTQGERHYARSLLGDKKEQRKAATSTPDQPLKGKAAADVEVNISSPLPRLHHSQKMGFNEEETMAIIEHLALMEEKMNHLERHLKNLALHQQALTPHTSGDLGDWQKEKGKFIKELVQLGKAVEQTKSQVAQMPTAPQEPPSPVTWVRPSWGQWLMAALVAGLVAGVMVAVVSPLMQLIWQEASKLW